MLMYNRDNFRDLYAEKPKGVTRQEYADQVGATPNERYYVYMAGRAKRFLREYNDRYRAGRPEVLLDLILTVLPSICTIFSLNRGTQRYQHSLKISLL
jgi:hypothetical protein